jgi:hypothetical protein
MAIHGEKVALAALTEAIDASLTGRKVIAADGGMNEKALSKILAGAWGVPTELLDSLDNATLLDWLRRWGRRRGFEVREIDPAELNAQLAEAARNFVHLWDLAQVVGDQGKR